MNKLLSLEWLRGVAALSVCQMHIFCTSDFFSKNDIFFQKYILPLSIAGRTGVVIFFIISGFVIPYSMHKSQYKINNIGRFLLRRLVRLEPLYLLSLVLIIIALWGVSMLKQTQFIINWVDVFLHVGYLNIFFGKPFLCCVYWSLAIEFQYYLLIALSYPLLVHSNHIVRLLTFFIILGVCVKLSYYIPHTFIFVHFPFFLLGFAVFLEKTGHISKLMLIIKILILLPIIYFLHYKANTFFALFTVLIIYFNFDIKWKPLHYLGKISYSLYLFHWLIGLEIMRNLFVYFMPTPVSEWTKIAFCLASIGLSIAFAALMYNLFEKRTIEWSKKIKYKNEEK